MYSTSSRASASGVVVGRMPVSKSPDHSANHKKKEQKSLCKVLIYLIYINSYKSGLWELMTHYASLVGIGAEVGTFNFTTKLNHKSGAASTASVIGRGMQHQSHGGDALYLYRASSVSEFNKHK